MNKGQCDYSARDATLSRIPVGIHLKSVKPLYVQGFKAEGLSN